METHKRTEIIKNKQIYSIQVYNRMYTQYNSYTHHRIVDENNNAFYIQSIVYKILWHRDNDIISTSICLVINICDIDQQICAHKILCKSVCLKTMDASYYYTIAFGGGGVNVGVCCFEASTTRIHTHNFDSEIGNIKYFLN